VNIRDRYTRVSQLSRIIQWIIRGSLILVPASFGVIFALDYFGIPGVTTNVGFTWRMENQYGDLVTKVRLIDVLIRGPLALLFVYTAIAPVYHFDRLLTLYRRRTYFAAEIEHHLRRMGFLLFALQVLDVLIEPLSRYTTYLVRNRGGYRLEFSLEPSHVALMVVALFIIALAYLMGLAHEAIEEAELTI
jgi:hypothetical protein